MSLEDFDLWYNMDTETASEVTREDVFLDETLNTSTVRWSSGIFGMRAIEHDVEDFDAWCDENLPYKWQGLYAKAHEEELAEDIREDQVHGVGGG